VTAQLAAIPAVVAGSPGAYDVYRRLVANPRMSARLLLRGCGGSGKTALVGAMRNVLRAFGIAVAGTVAEFDPDVHSGLIVDDAHLMAPGELQELAALAHRDDLLLVVATRRRYDDVDLAALQWLFESVGTTVDLAPLDEQGVAAAARVQFGSPVTHKFVGTVFGLTDGHSYLVDAALRAGDPRIATPSGDRVVTAVRAAIADRLQRMSRDVLHTMALHAIGAELDELDLPTLLDIDDERAQLALADATGCGLMTRTGELGPLVEAELFALLGRHQIESLSRRLFESRVAGGKLDPLLASKVLEHGVRDARLEAVLLDAAERRADSDRALALRFYQAAAKGVTDPDLSVRRARAACALGRFDEALGIIDASWEHASGSTLCTAARVAASAWCARGMLARGAEIYGWVGTDRVCEDGPVAALLLFCAGRPEAALEILSTSSTRPPTSDVSGNRLLAEAMAASLNVPGTTTLNMFARSVAVLETASGVRPDSASAVTAIAAMHAGDLPRARKVLQRSLDTGTDDSPQGIRHRLLLGWTAMMEGNFQAAATELTAIGQAGALPLREQFLADALRVGLARRRTDTGQLHAALARARESVDEYAVDLLSLLPVGELWAAAARIGKTNQVRHLVDEAFALLGRLGDPPFWASVMHWIGVTVALQSDSPDDLRFHARALRAAASQWEYASTLTSAGRVWLRMISGTVDLAEIARAAAGLQTIGFGWDGANLAGRAALRSADSRLSADLLQVARRVGQPMAAIDPATAPLDDTCALSERQREVAALLVKGLTYKGVGERLFISPKTVEYHVAEIKRRIGTETRSELLSRLHALDLSSAS
jgi:DNA-binding CsgD family transcriptional regulator